MALIDNKNQTLQEALKNALSNADQIDIAVGFFYFSGSFIFISIVRRIGILNFVAVLFMTC